MATFDIGRPEPDKTYILLAFDQMQDARDFKIAMCEDPELTDSADSWDHLKRTGRVRAVHNYTASDEESAAFMAETKRGILAAARGEVTDLMARVRERTRGTPEGTVDETVRQLRGGENE